MTSQVELVQSTDVVRSSIGGYIFIWRKNLNPSTILTDSDAERPYGCLGLIVSGITVDNVDSL